MQSNAACVIFQIGNMFWQYSNISNEAEWVYWCTIDNGIRTKTMEHIQNARCNACNLRFRLLNAFAVAVYRMQLKYWFHSLFQIHWIYDIQFWFVCILCPHKIVIVMWKQNRICVAVRPVSTFNQQPLTLLNTEKMIVFWCSVQCFAHGHFNSYSIHFQDSPSNGSNTGWLNSFGLENRSNEIINSALDISLIVRLTRKINFSISIEKIEAASRHNYPNSIPK